MAQCSPVLLEPIMKVEIATPSEATAKITGIVPQRRGQILGYDARPGWPGWDVVEATMPQSEIGDLIIELRSATAGVASYRATFDHMAELTGRLADQVMNAAAARRPEAKFVCECNIGRSAREREARWVDARVFDRRSDVTDPGASGWFPFIAVHPWAIAESLATPEHVFLNRRSILKGFGLGMAAAAALAALPDSDASRGSRSDRRSLPGQE